jgi:hypothetical protein
MLVEKIGGEGEIDSFLSPKGETQSEKRRLRLKKLKSILNRKPSSF